MPIRESEKSRYPANWGEISSQVKAEAGYRCEQCGAEHGHVILRGKHDGRWAWRDVNASVYENSRDAITGEEIPDGVWDTFEKDRLVRVILTVAHLDHVPENVERSNLKALCQRCHLSYDAAHHAANAAATRRARRAVGDLFDL